MLTLSLLASAAVPFAAAPAVAVAPTGVTTLVAPETGATVGANPVFTWTPVEGAPLYRFQLSTSSTFGTVSYNATTSNLHMTPPTAVPVGTVYWRVAPADTQGTPGTYTASHFERTWSNAPQLDAPAAGAMLNYPDDTLLFRWDAVPGAKLYRIQFDDNTGFASPETHTTNNTSYTQTEPKTKDQELYWRVQGSTDGVDTPWSEVRAYTVRWDDKPTLLAPAAGAEVTDVVFEWKPVPGAVSYELQVSPNIDFTNDITIGVKTVSTRYSPPVTIDNDQYYWRVRTRDNLMSATANTGPWSEAIESGDSGLFETAMFTRRWSATPTLRTPANTSNHVTVPTLRWDPVKNASHYEVWLGTTVNFTQNTYLTCTTNQTSFTPYTTEVSNGLPTPVLPKGSCFAPNFQKEGIPYYWKVRALDGPANTQGGILGEFSPTWWYVFKHDAHPELLAPDHAATTSAPVLTWEPVTGISRYQVHIFNGGAKLSGSPFTTFGNSFTPTAKLSDGTTYTWYVTTMDDHDRSGSIPAPESHRSFTYVAPVAENTFPQVVAVGPGDDTIFGVMPSMEWLPVTGATSYKIQFGLEGLQDLPLIGTTANTAFTSQDAPPNPGTYVWLVRAYGDGGAYLGASLLHRVVIEELGVVENIAPVKCTPEAPCALLPETPTLSWHPVQYAAGYRVHLSRDAAFTNVERIYDTSYTSLTPRESLLDSAAGQAWYWFAQPCRSVTDSIGCGRFDSSVFGTAFAFRKRSLPVEPLSPADGVTISGNDAARPDPITFTWADYTDTNGNAEPASGQGARWYRVQVSTVSDFATLLDDVTVDQTTYTPWSMTYPEGPLYWRVGVIDNSNNQLTFSQPRLVHKDTPDLVPLKPADGASLPGTPYFQWAGQAHAYKYEVEIYKNGDTLFSAINKVFATTPTTRLTAFTPTTPLGQGTYAWRVRRQDANPTPQRTGPWVSGGTFTVSKPAPELVSPDQGATLTSHDLVFSWSSVPGAAAYVFEASSNPGFTGTHLDTVTTVMTDWAPTKKYADGVIYWRVKVVDGAGNVLGTSATRSVGKDSTAPKVLTKAPTTNLAHLGGTLTATFSEPVKNLSATTFTMKIANTNTNVPGVVSPALPSTPATTATFKPSAALVPGETYTMTLSSSITDQSGNPLPVTTWNVRASTLVDSVSPVVQHFWDRDAHTAASGGAFLASRTQLSKVTYSFTGTSVQVLGRRARDGGYAEVWLDGVKQAPASFYYSADQWKAVVWQKTGLANAAHKLELRVTNTKPAASTGTWVYPDAFRTGVTTYEETHANVVQSFRQVAATSAFGGSYEMALHTASGDTNAQPYVLVKFKGTGISWKGFRSNAGGIAGVYVDNLGKGTVDQYGAATATPQVLWSASGLTNATHTLRIVLTGAKRSTSAGYNITFDSFTVV